MFSPLTGLQGMCMDGSEALDPPDDREHCEAISKSAQDVPSDSRL